MIKRGKIVHIASPIANNDDLSLLKFINIFPYLLPPLRFNITICFQLVNTPQPTLQRLLSLLNPSAWAKLLKDYPGLLQIHLFMILQFGVQLGYKGLINAFIISKNLVLALVDA